MFANGHKDRATWDKPVVKVDLQAPKKNLDQDTNAENSKILNEAIMEFSNKVNQVNETDGSNDKSLGKLKLEGNYELEMGADIVEDKSNKEDGLSEFTLVPTQKELEVAQ